MYVHIQDGSVMNDQLNIPLFYSQTMQPTSIYAARYNTQFARN